MARPVDGLLLDFWREVCKTRCGESFVPALGERAEHGQGGCHNSEASPLGSL